MAISVPLRREHDNAYKISANPGVLPTRFAFERKSNSQARPYANSARNCDGLDHIIEATASDRRLWVPLLQASKVYEEH